MKYTSAPIKLPPTKPKNLKYTIKRYNFSKKRYELTDWLGNVRVVINDKKTPMGTDSSNMTYAAQVLEVNDYSPFGMVSLCDALGILLRNSVVYFLIAKSFQGHKVLLFIKNIPVLKTF